MTSKPIRRAGQPPKERATAKAPPERAVAVGPRGDPIARAPRPHVSRTPKPRPVGKRPNPRTPKLVRHVNAGGLNDLFAMFPDLPRPARPEPRLRNKRKASRR